MELDTVVATVRSLPRDTTLTWTSARWLIHPDAQHHRPGIDIHCPQVSSPLNEPVWSIHIPGGLEDKPGVWEWFPGCPLGSLLIVLPQAFSVWHVGNDGDEIGYEWWTGNGSVLTRGQDRPTPAQWAELEATREEHGAGRAQIRQSAAWSNTSISRTLEAWCREVAGRADIRCEHDGNLSIPGFDPMEILPPGIADPDTYEIAPHLRVNGRVMDRLLEMDPDTAARVSAQLVRIARTYFPDEGSVPEATDSLD